MMRWSYLLTIVALVLGFSTQIMLAQDARSIRAGPLEVHILRVETRNSFPVFIAPGPIFSASKKEDELFSLGEVSVEKGDAIGLRVELEVRNTSGSIQPFRLGDLSVVDHLHTNEFISVGLGDGDYLFGHTNGDRRVVSQTKVNLKPGEKLKVGYIFGVKKDSPHWKLMYKNHRWVDVKNQDKP